MGHNPKKENVLVSLRSAQKFVCAASLPGILGALCLTTDFIIIFFNNSNYSGQHHADAGAGLEFFERMFKELVELPIIVEDLGLITPEMNLLRENCRFPKMEVL